MAASKDIKSAKAPSFPPARLKRIMQADEDVGKLAQSTPVAVGKALEGFLRDLVEAAAREASVRRSNKVNASHFKRAIGQTPAFDFLKDAVAHVADAVDHDGNGDPDDKPKRARKLKGQMNSASGTSSKPRKKKRKDTEDEAEDDAESAQMADPAAVYAANDDDDYDG